MATPRHGRKSRLLLDMSAGADSAAVLVPMLVDWSTDRATDDLDVSHCDSDNMEYVSGLPDYKGTCSVNMDADSDLLYNCADGQPRMHYLYPERDAAEGKRRYNYGLIILAVSESGGAKAKLGQTVTFKAAGPITRVFI